MNDTLLLRAIGVTKFAHEMFTSALKEHCKKMCYSYIASGADLVFQTRAQLS